MALGRNIDRIERNIESIESKFAKIFKRPKNREDGSDFDDFWTESIVSTQSIFSKIFERTKNYRIDRIDRLDRSIDRSYRSMTALFSEMPSCLPARQNSLSDKARSRETLPSIFFHFYCNGANET